MFTKLFNWIRDHLLFTVIIIFAFGVVGWAANFRLVVGLPWPGWTGLNDFTLIDLLDLLILPITLPLIARLFQREEKQRALDRQHEEVLQNYLDNLSNLLLDEKLRDPEQASAVHNVVQIRTTTAIRSLDGKRINILLQFLRSADLYDHIFEKSYMSGINLSGANLKEVNLYDANLSGADLRGAIMDKANLSGANLYRADLSGALLWEADLSRAYLYDAILSGAILKDVDLRGANLRGADLSRVISFTESRMEGALYDEKTKWPDDFDPKKAGAVLKE